MTSIALLDTSHAEEFRSVFREVFGADITPALADWKYGTADRGRQFGAFSAEPRMVAHCGLTFRTALIENQTRRIAQVGDLCSVRNKPGGLARGSSVFGTLLRHTLDQIPSKDNPEAVFYGFPGDTAMKLIKRLGIGTSLNVIHELSFLPTHSGPVQASLNSIFSADLRLVRVTDFGGGFARLAERLWRRMAKDFGSGALGVRDAQYLRFRYLKHPDHGYEIYRVTGLFGRTIGLAVCRRTGTELELMDLVASLTDMSRCIVTLQRNLSAMGIGILKMWLLDRYARHFSALAASVVPLQFHLMVEYRNSGGIDRFKDRWWLTSGDADYR